MIETIEKFPDECDSCSNLLGGRSDFKCSKCRFYYFDIYIEDDFSQQFAGRKMFSN